VLGFYLLISFGARSAVGQAFAAIAGHSLAFSFQGLLLASLIAGMLGFVWLKFFGRAIGH